ncbi:MAG: DUF2267 domain-containing protein [Brevundimonas sp.]
MTAGLAVFDTTIQETNTFLNLVRAQLPPCDQQQAYAATRAVLHTLRDRLPLAVVMGLSAQLPMLMRGFFLEGWRPGQDPSDARDLQTFAKAVEQQLPPFFPREPAAAVEAVFSVLGQRLAPGQSDKIAGSLPERLRRVWLDAQRAAGPGAAVS